MIGKMASDQGRARGLYDEQLQRKQQEKALAARKAAQRAKASLLFAGERPVPAKSDA